MVQNSPKNEYLIFVSHISFLVSHISYHVLSHAEWESYDEWLFSGEKTYTASGNMRAPTTKLLLRWIKDGWNKITPEIIRRSFKKTGISNQMDRTEDHLLDMDSDEDPFDGFDAADVAMSRCLLRIKDQTLMVL